MKTGGVIITLPPPPPPPLPPSPPPPHGPCLTCLISPKYLWRRVKSERDTNTVVNEESEEDEGSRIDQEKAGYSGGEGEMRIRRVSRKDAGHYSVKVTSPRGTSSAPFFVNVQCECVCVWRRTMKCLFLCARP
ncbi:hypothetical protein E2C01_087483 [Portunus trituberculatus]|uniref:Immunoglobulin I-set domain-containing protein n=1 Tax=Portunus trituberculatus TaxID=210409 RepID=A0A5B7JCL2_PORTR|nr:hypothetical protein [Portunus trituberculatus]